MTQMKPSFEVPNEMREMANKSVQQARTAFETFMKNAQKATETFESGAGTMQNSALEASKKTLAVAEANVQAAFELASKLVTAKSLDEVMRYQTEFMRAQMASFQGQMAEAGSAMQQQMKEASEAVQKMAQPPMKG